MHGFNESEAVKITYSELPMFSPVEIASAFAILIVIALILLEVINTRNGFPTIPEDDDDY